jgi:hypothetical protein
MADQRPVLQTTCASLLVHAQEHLQLAPPYAINQLWGLTGKAEALRTFRF